MKKQLLIAAILMGSVHLFAQTSKDGVHFQTRVLSTDHIREVSVESVDGDIVLEGVPDAQARIEVFVRPVDPNDPISIDTMRKRISRDYDVSVNVVDQHLIAIARAKPGFKNWEHGCSISFRVYVPKSVSSHLQTNAGNIALDALAGGTQQLLTTAGNLHILHVDGKIEGRATAGKIRAERCSGEIKLTDSGGPMDLEGLDGSIEARTTDNYLYANRISGTFIASTTAGPINLTNLSCSLDAYTNDTKMNISILNPGKYIKLRSLNAIQVELPAGIGMNLKLHAGQIKVPAIGFKAYATTEHDMEGVLGSGGVLLTADGGRNGNVQLTTR